ncbi:MAG TPA: hypothetical protein VF263_19805 [Longimicrobiaceae bacterium]
MASQPAYSIDVQDRDIVVRLHGDVLDRDAVSKFLDFLELEAIRRRSQLTDEQADALAAEVDRSAWERLRANVQEP